MAVKKACRNCVRVKAIVADGLCFVCRKASKGLTGEAKAKALASIKEGIDRGELKTRGKGSKSAASAPAVTTNPMSPEKIEKVKRCLQNLKGKRSGSELLAFGGSIPLPLGFPGSVIPITLRLNIEVGIQIVN